MQADENYTEFQHVILPELCHAVHKHFFVS